MFSVEDTLERGGVEGAMASAVDASADAPAAATEEQPVTDAESSAAAAEGDARPAEEAAPSIAEDGGRDAEAANNGPREGGAEAQPEQAPAESSGGHEDDLENAAGDAASAAEEGSDDFLDNAANAEQPAPPEAANEMPGDVENQSGANPSTLDESDETEDDFQENVVDVEEAVRAGSMKASSEGFGGVQDSRNQEDAEDAASRGMSVEFSLASFHSCASSGRDDGGANFHSAETSPKVLKALPVGLNETMDISSSEESNPRGVEGRMSRHGGHPSRRSRRGQSRRSYARKPAGAAGVGCATTNNRRNVIIAGVVSVALIVLVGLGIGLSKRGNEAADEAAQKTMFLETEGKPSMSPSESPTATATDVPSGTPTDVHSSVPSGMPTDPPIPAPSGAPTPTPSFRPSASPSANPTGFPSASPTVSIAPTKPFLLGDLAVARPDLGIRMSTGLKAKLIATTGQKTTYADGRKSKDNYHGMMDGSGIAKLDEGYVYMSNSEMGAGLGGVYGLYFNDAGEVTNYKALLTGTTRNCGGGLSSWNTWISCEEVRQGQCWQVDPDPASPNHATPKETLLGGAGGRYESVACDNSNPAKPVFFTTEDHEFGALRRFEADHGDGWDALHTGGSTTFLRILDGHRFEWTLDEAAARMSANVYYMNAEGISYHDGMVYFTAKKTKTLLILDLENLTYKAETTGGKFVGQGDFNAQPDQILLGTHKRWIYFTEDGGNPGVYVRDKRSGVYTALFESDGTYVGDETVGVALSPDRRRFYAGYQDAGKLIEFTRDDGLPFE